MKTDSFLEQVLLSSENLNEAFLQVKRNKGAEGVDGMKVNELSEHLKAYQFKAKSHQVSVKKLQDKLKRLTSRRWGVRGR